MTVNKHIIVGNLGADPETRSTNSGTQVCNLRIATTRRVKNGDEWSNTTDWHNVVAFGRTAERCREYLGKGRQVYIEGSVQTRKWQDKDGNDRYSTETVVEVLRFLSDGKREAGGGERPPRRPPSRAERQAAQSTDNDIPF